MRSGSLGKTARLSSSSDWKNVSCSGDATPRGRSCSSRCTPPTVGFSRWGCRKEVMGRLAGFQQQAVQRCVALLRRHWGAMLCRLGRFGQDFRRVRYPARVRQPAERRPAARENLDPGLWSFVPHNFKTTGAPIDSRSGESSLPRSPWSRCRTSWTSRMSRRPVLRQRLRAELKRYQEQYDLILVDESHNFRNPRTKALSRPHGDHTRWQTGH